jgi:hypothetical protein
MENGNTIPAGRATRLRAALRRGRVQARIGAFCLFAVGVGLSVGLGERPPWRFLSTLLLMWAWLLYAHTHPAWLDRLVGGKPTRVVSETPAATSAAPATTAVRTPSAMVYLATVVGLVLLIFAAAKLSGLG